MGKLKEEFAEISLSSLCSGWQLFILKYRLNNRDYPLNP